jgi:hypothetical protein
MIFVKGGIIFLILRGCLDQLELSMADEWLTIKLPNRNKQLLPKKVHVLQAPAARATFTQKKVHYQECVEIIKTIVAMHPSNSGSSLIFLILPNQHVGSSDWITQSGFLSELTNIESVAISLRTDFLLLFKPVWLFEQ